jgi:glucosamine-6-phosphate deaminase
MKKSGELNLMVNVFPTRIEMGQFAGKEIENKIIKLLDKKPEIRMIFAAAPSQNEMLDYLSGSKRIQWNRISAFNMDEYLGLSRKAPQLFSVYLSERIFERVNFKQVHLIDGHAPVEDELMRYSALITEAPIDIVCLGIGENGHIAFNDPPFADFNDPMVIKMVKLDKLCRTQQVNEGCFTNLDEVPKKALTLTIPVIMSATSLFCVVPGSGKREAVYKTLYGPVDTSCPASVLQTHPDCKFYFDEEAFSEK